MSVPRERNAKDACCSRVLIMVPTTTGVPGTGVDGHLCDTPTRRSDEVHVRIACLMWPMECARMPGPEPDTKWDGLMLSSHGCSVRSADTAVAERCEIRFRTEIHVAQCGVCSNASS